MEPCPSRWPTKFVQISENENSFEQQVSAVQLWKNDFATFDAEDKNLESYFPALFQE